MYIKYKYVLSNSFIVKIIRFKKVVSHKLYMRSTPWHEKREGSDLEGL